MVPPVLALLSAFAYGAADFLGGLATHRSNTMAVVIVSQAAGLALLMAVLLFLPGSPPAARDLAWGAIAGLAGGGGIALLYRALAIGPMSIVAPLTAVCAALIPVAAGIALGERLTSVRVAGIALALAAIVLVGQERGRGGGTAVRRDGLRIAIASGVLIGLFLVALARAAPASGLWPLIPARVTSVAMFAAIALATGRSIRMPAPVLKIAAGGGALDMLANALYLAAVQRGPLSLMATLASLYPASTIVLARIFLGERLSPAQLGGIACAGVATVLLVSG
ncbi:MAG TPA: DMT family transporter [Vicinamibacterales bacterium]|nr:DMT family transporter [Vicinamibacterales bacterium]